MWGSIHNENEVYTEYLDTSRDEWRDGALSCPEEDPARELIEQTGLSRRALLDLRAGRSRPHPNNQKKIAQIVRKFLKSERAATAIPTTAKVARRVRA